MNRRIFCSTAVKSLAAAALAPVMPYVAGLMNGRRQPLIIPSLYLEPYSPGDIIAIGSLQFSVFLVAKEAIIFNPLSGKFDRPLEFPSFDRQPVA